MRTICDKMQTQCKTNEKDSKTRKDNGSACFSDISLIFSTFFKVFDTFPVGALNLQKKCEQFAKMLRKNANKCTNETFVSKARVQYANSKCKMNPHTKKCKPKLQKKTKLKNQKQTVPNPYQGRTLISLRLIRRIQSFCFAPG